MMKCWASLRFNLLYNTLPIIDNCALLLWQEWQDHHVVNNKHEAMSGIWNSVLKKVMMI